MTSPPNQNSDTESLLNTPEWLYVATLDTELARRARSGQRLPARIPIGDLPGASDTALR